MLEGLDGDREYRGPRLFIAVFYGALVLWTVISAFFIGAEAGEGKWPVVRLFMIGFVVSYTWYFSLAIVYRLRLKYDGSLEMISFRGSREAPSLVLERIEGPRIAILPVGFLRLRFANEKVYLFSRFTSPALREMVRALKRVNPSLTIVFVPS